MAPLILGRISVHTPNFVLIGSGVSYLEVPHFMSISVFFFFVFRFYFFNAATAQTDRPIAVLNSSNAAFRAKVRAFCKLVYTNMNFGGHLPPKPPKKLAWLGIPMLNYFFLIVYKIHTGRPIHIKFSGIEEIHILVSDMSKK